MSKSKPKWQKTIIPKRIKIILWQIMKDYPTQNDREIAVAKHEHDADDDAYFKNSRDTFKRLLQELVEMPAAELNTLPPDLIEYAKNIREDLKDNVSFVLSFDRLTSLQEKAYFMHIKDLVTAARRLVVNLEFYSGDPLDTTALVDSILANEPKDADIAQQLRFDMSTDCLFSHMQSELPQLADLTNWDFLPIKDVNAIIFELNRRSAQYEFPGKCSICEHWLVKR
jgi:hypothetical protein